MPGLGFSRRRVLDLAGRAALASFLPRAGFGQGLAKEIVGDASLRAHAEAKGLLTGFAVVPTLLRTDAGYTSLVLEQANVIVAENEMKWAALRPSAITFKFDQADALVEFAEQNQMKIRGHNLLWHRSIPKWFTDTATKANARQLLETHIETVAGRYAGRIHSWDVVNEAIQTSDGRADGLRDSPWLRLVGDDYIDVAFHAARRADAEALLTYNDYGIEAEWKGDEAKRQALLKLLRGMRTRKVPIDAVGIQSHISVGPDSHYGSGLMKFIASVREMGLQVFVTEMDVNDRHIGPDIAERDAAVAAAYRGYLEMVCGDPAVKAVLMWGVSDRNTWLNHEDSRTDGKPERPLLFDSEYKPKRAFFATRDAYYGLELRH